MTIETFWGEEPRIRSEVQFLDQLKADLDSCGIAATILVNFFTKSSLRQIDFLVITDRHVCHVELKNYTDPLVGYINGLWSSRRADGSLKVIDRQNPYVQALECKYALSDDMYSLAAQDDSIPTPSKGKFYTQFDSVVCIFPRLEDESQVPNDFKVKTLGYSDFFTFLTSPGAHPPWTRDHWEAFIRMLGLTKATTFSRQDLAANTAQIIVSKYSRRFKDFYSSRLHELVPLPLDLGSSSVPSTHLIDILQKARHAQLIGPSGCGKSHLVKHAALTLLSADCVAILVEAGMYEGRLHTLLNRSIGRFSTNSADELVRAAAINGQTLLLVVDGFNECPEPLQERLLGDLSAFCLRAPALTLITSQTTISLPEILGSKVIRAGELTEADRKAMLGSYGSPEILQFCEPFTTAYELSIASECATELAATTTRANLFDAFIRKRLSRTPSPAYLRETLRRLAFVMNERLTIWLPADDVWRITEQFLAERSAPASVVDDVFACSITTTRQGKFSFTHELLGRFLTAEALLLKSRDSTELVDELKKPRHQDLAQFVVTLERDATRVRQLVNGLAEWDLFADALLGSYGLVAAGVAQSSARELFRSITSGMDHTIFTVRNEYELQVSGGHEVSDAEHALLAAVGAQVFYGQFVEEVVALLDATDAACRRSADAQAATGTRPTASAVVSAVLIGLSSASAKVAARTILEACKHARMDSRFRSRSEVTGVSDDEIAALVADASPQDHGRLLLVCCLLSSTYSLKAAALAPRVLQLCWSSAAYHVQLEGLMMTQSFAAAVDGHPLHNKIVGILDSFDTANIGIGISSQLVDTMNSYGMIESPVQADYVKLEINEILQGEATSEQCERAYGIVSAQFEDIVGEAYCIAIDALDTRSRTALFTIAALGAPSHGFWNDWLLRRLIDFADQHTLPAFERWATKLNTDTPFIQAVGSCYALAMEGCAQFLATPPLLKESRSQDEEAWQCYGGIIFWLHRPGLSDKNITEHCAPLWQKLSTELAPAAADVLHWLSKPEVAVVAKNKPIPRQMIGSFRKELRNILEWSLEHRNSLTSIFGKRSRGFPMRGRGGLADYIIDILGYVGDADTVELLGNYVDDPILGPTAIKSIRKLTEERV